MSRRPRPSRPILVLLALLTLVSGPAQAWQAPVSESLPSALLQVIDEAPSASCSVWSRAFADRLAPTVPAAIRAEWGRMPGREELDAWATGRLARLEDPAERARFRRLVRRAEQSVARWKRRLEPSPARGVLFTFGGEIRVRPLEQGSTWIFPLDRLGEEPDEVVITRLVQRDLDERAPLPPDPEPRWNVLRELLTRYRVLETLDPTPPALDAWSGLSPGQITGWMPGRRTLVRDVREAWRDGIQVDPLLERFALALGFERVLRHHPWQTCTGWDLRTWQDELRKALDTI